MVVAAGDTNGDARPDFILAGPTKVLAGGDVIKIYGGRHVFAFSGPPIPVTSLSYPGMPGIAGVPALAGEGSTKPNALLSLHLESAAPSQPVLLVVGGAIAAPALSTLKIWPSLELVAPLGLTDLQGRLDVSGRWPPAMAYGEVLVAQAVVLDPAAVTGLATSNTLQLTSQ